MPLADLPTPCLLVEQKRLQSNISNMQARADREDAALRPHTKTHKSVAIARRQKKAGASGLTVAKPAEAEIFVDAGFDDVRLAYPVVGREKHARLQQLREKGAQISFCVDTVDGATHAASCYRDHQPADVLIEIDVGQGRCGVRWDDEEAVLAVARTVVEEPALNLKGILTHAGQGYYGPKEGETPVEALRRVSADERDRMLDVATLLYEAGIDAAQPETLEISVGSTPTMSVFKNASRGGFQVTEMRPGNYVLFDAMQVSLGSAQWGDCALTALTTVVSKQQRNGATWMYLDAGKKVFTSDKGYLQKSHGQILDDPSAMVPFDGASIQSLSEEHGWVKLADGQSFEVGERLRVVPNHACTAVHTQNQLVLVNQGDVVETLGVDARWAST